MKKIVFKGAAKLSQEQVARMLGISRGLVCAVELSALRKIESHPSMPRIKALWDKHTEGEE